MIEEGPMTEQASSFTIQYGNFLFKYRNTVFPIVLIALLAGLRPVEPLGDARLDFWMDILGLSVALLGQGLRVLVIGLAYIRRGGRNKRVHADRLVTDGIFGHCRNPLYVGNLLILAGLFIVHNNPWVYLIGGAFFLYGYHAIVAAEESFLLDKFGEDYAAYCRRVNRWLPRLEHLTQTLQGMEFHWRRVVAKDYSSAYAWMVLAILLLAGEVVLRSTWPENSTPLFGLGIALAGITLAFLVAWRLKKTRRLGNVK
jgi:protein-S-isoprenylcysteine O-methyltransferase Ste14